MTEPTIAPAQESAARNEPAVDAGSSRTGSESSATGHDLGSELFTAGLGLMSAVASLLAKPSDQSSNQPPPAEPHEFDTCGICPLCLALTALRERDAEVAEVMEMAMRGVSVSAERIAGLVPRATDAITEVLMGQLVKAAMSRFTGR